MSLACERNFLPDTVATVRIAADMSSHCHERARPHLEHMHGLNIMSKADWYVSHDAMKGLVSMKKARIFGPPATVGRSWKK